MDFTNRPLYILRGQTDVFIYLKFVVANGADPDKMSRLGITSGSSLFAKEKVYGSVRKVNDLSWLINVVI